MEQLINGFKLLSDENRLRIIMLLQQEDLCVCQICGALDISQPKASKHLAKLRDLGLVKGRRKEQFIYYSLEIKNAVIKQVIAVLAENVKDYPMLQEDKNRLKKKEEYLSQCISLQKR